MGSSGIHHANDDAKKAITHERVRLTHEALEDEEVKMLIITGANQRFVAGADIANIQENIQMLRNAPTHQSDGTL